MECKSTVPTEGIAKDFSSKKAEQVMARIMPRQIGDCPDNSPTTSVRHLQNDSPTTARRSEAFLATDSNAMHLLINLKTIVDTLRNLTLRAGQQPFRFASMEYFQRLRMLYLSANEMNVSLLGAINRVRVSEPINNIADMDEDELTNVLSTEFMIHWLAHPIAGSSLFSLASPNPLRLGAHYYARDERMKRPTVVGMNMSFVQWQANIWPHIASTITEAARFLESSGNHLVN